MIAFVRRLIASILIATSGTATAMDAGFVSFELPENRWGCSQERTEWICTPKGGPERTQAMIVLSAKVAGPEDNLKLYMKYLKEPKMLVTPGRTPAPSKMIHTKTRTIGPQQWVESLHLASEVPGFYTLYLATRAGDLSVLVTLSAAEAHVQKFNASFAQLTQSLRLDKDFILQSSQMGNGSPVNAPGIADEAIPESEVEEEAHPQQHPWKLLSLIGVLILLGVSGYFFYQRKS